MLFGWEMLCNMCVLHFPSFIYAKLKQHAVCQVVFAVKFCLAMSTLDIGIQLNKEP